MQTQQLAEQEGRTLQFPIVDQAPATTLPAAAQRANMGLAFDASGNPIAGTLPSAAVSSAMMPVFQAASLTAARTALGLGAAALASIGQSGANVPLLNAAMALTSSTAGAAVETFLTLLRNKGAAGAANDFLEALAFDGMNASTVEKTFARVYAQIVAATAGSETGQLLWDTIVAGSLTNRMILQSGLRIGTPSGGDKGVGSLNAQSVYLNGSGPIKGIAQIVNFETGAVATGTTQIPFDDTIPQNTEGDQYMQLQISPVNSSSTLLIDVVAYLSNTEFELREPFCGPVSETLRQTRWRLRRSERPRRAVPCRSCSGTR